MTSVDKTITSVTKSAFRTTASFLSYMCQIIEESLQIEISCILREYRARTLKRRISSDVSVSVI